MAEFNRFYASYTMMMQNASGHYNFGSLFEAHNLEGCDKSAMLYFAEQHISYELDRLEGTAYSQGWSDERLESALADIADEREELIAAALAWAAAQVEETPAQEVVAAPRTITETRAAQLLRNYGQRSSFKSASKRQVDALRPVASELGVSISQATQYMDASFAYRNGKITAEEWRYIQRNA